MEYTWSVPDRSSEERLAREEMISRIEGAIGTLDFAWSTMTTESMRTLYQYVLDKEKK